VSSLDKNEYGDEMFIYAMVLMEEMEEMEEREKNAQNEEKRRILKHETD
jgi:hypothetical protein